MKIAYDQAKRAWVLNERQLDMADVATVFDDFHLTRYDSNHSDVEDRYITVGTMREQVVLVVWTEREDERRIVTMWKANERERELLRRERERSG